MPPGLRLMIVGAPKSGSTALFRYLADHPEVRSHVHREMPFFGRDEEYAEGWELALAKYFPPDVANAPLVAKHTMAMYDPVAISRIVSLPSVVVVAVLRDPVPRAYSHYQYARLRGWEDAPTFEEGLRREPLRAPRSPRQARDLQYVGDGIYAPHVQQLLDAVPPSRLRIHLSNELRSDPRRICADLFSLAGLSPFDPDVTRRHNEGHSARSERFARAFLAAQQPGSPVRALASRFLPSRALYRARFLVNRLNEANRPIPPMSPVVEGQLRERFSAPNATLQAALGRPLGWSS